MMRGVEVAPASHVDRVAVSHLVPYRDSVCRYHYHLKAESMCVIVSLRSRLQQGCCAQNVLTRNWAFMLRRYDTPASSAEQLLHSAKVLTPMAPTSFITVFLRLSREDAGRVPKRLNFSYSATTRWALHRCSSL